jgi:hypothetical protein
LCHSTQRGAKAATRLGDRRLAVTAVAFVLWCSAVQALGVERTGLLAGVLPVSTLAVAALRAGGDEGGPRALRHLGRDPRSGRRLDGRDRRPRVRIRRVPQEVARSDPMSVGDPL